MHPVPQFDKKLPAAATYRTPDAAQLQGRFNDAAALVDPADKLLALRQLREDAEKILRREDDFQSAKLWDIEINMPVSMTAGIVGAVGGAALLGPAGLLAGLVAIPVYAGIIWRNKRHLRRYDDAYLDIKDAVKTCWDADTLLSQELKDADVNAIARCEKAAEVFNVFTVLREKFLVAAELERIRAKAALPAPKKEGGGFQL